MQSDDQAFLDQIEQNIRSKDNEQENARQEAEQRAREMERIRKASTQPPAGKAAAPPAKEKPSELEKDPRYREYFERLRKQKGIATPGEGAPSKGSTTAAPDNVITPGRGGAQSISPGAIVRFDDKSIGIYKDAVSGRDYALFYFLQPDGQFVPEGVFLQSYQAKVIGTLPENYFSELRDSSTWDRDLILYHLSSFDHVAFLDNLGEHEERKPKPGSSATSGSITTAASHTPAGDKSSVPKEKKSQQKTSSPSSTPPPAKTKPEPQLESAPPASAEQPAASQEGLVKGRKFQIKFGGKQWEAVYWMDDAEGSIVAHSTHGHWSLMRLDFERFKDSLELGDIVDADTMDSIAKDAAGAK